LRRSWDDSAGLEPVRKADVSLNLSGQDLQTWIGVLSALPGAPATESGILAWVEGPLRKFFPFDGFVGSPGRLSGGRFRRRSLVTSGTPRELLAILEHPLDLNARGCFAWWLSNRRPFFLDETGARDEQDLSIPATRREIEEIERFALGAVAAHGVIDPYLNAGTYISFSGVPRTRPKRTLAAIDLIAPVLHSLFLAAKPADGGVVNRR
jgi:hypothetical protein